MNANMRLSPRLAIALATLFLGTATAASAAVTTVYKCFDPNLNVSERIIFPSSPTESNGIEDARFVRFTHDDGRVCYMVPVGRGVTHEYQDMYQSFTCCVGTGMESHALHGDGIYYESGDKLWVNIYAPSKAEWKSAGVKLDVATDMPAGDSVTINVAPQQPSKKFTLALRRPEPHQHPVVEHLDRELVVAGQCHC